ncbi:MAG: hypothetical protein Q8K93_07550 [Reyranella sp.]|nr:hypothetical protein [Reyranella sp.]
MSLPASMRELPRVLIADDHSIVCFGLRQILDQEGRFAVCGAAASTVKAKR